MKLSAALNTQVPAGFIVGPTAMKGYYELRPLYTALSTLAVAHLARFQIAGLFQNDPCIEGNDWTRADRITRDLWNTWPELGLRVLNIPGLYNALRKVRVPYKAYKWTLAQAIDKVGLDIVPMLKAVRL